MVTSTTARAGLDSLTARRFRTGRACLDFAHTGGVGDWMSAELVHDGADAARWLALVLDLDAVTAGDDDVAPLRELREAIWQLAHARLASARLPARDVAVINRFAAAAPLRPELRADGRARMREPDAAQALSALARDAIDLLGGPLGDRVHECAADNCQLLFVDASRAGKRRWCSMQRCGNLAKVRAHRKAAD